MNVRSDHTHSMSPPPEPPSKLDYWGPKVSKWVIFVMLFSVVALIVGGWDAGWASVGKMFGPTAWQPEGSDKMDGASWVLVKVCFFIGVFEISDLCGDILSGLVKLWKARRAK